MSECWHLVCDKTRKQLWIGQGNEGINLYSGDEKVMDNLEAFLRDTAGSPLVLVNDQDERSFMYTEFENIKGKVTRWQWLRNLIRRLRQWHYDVNHPNIAWGM